MNSDEEIEKLHNEIKLLRFDLDIRTDRLIKLLDNTQQLTMKSIKLNNITNINNKIRIWFQLIFFVFILYRLCKTEEFMEFISILLHFDFLSDNLT